MTEALDALGRIGKITFVAPAPGFSTTTSYAGPDTPVTRMVQHYGAAGSATYGDAVGGALSARRRRTWRITWPAKTTPAVVTERPAWRSASAVQVLQVYPPS